MTRVVLAATNAEPGRGAGSATGLSVAGRGAQELLEGARESFAFGPHFPSPGVQTLSNFPMRFPGTQSASVAVNMHQRVSLALLLLAVPHTASLATPVLETVALRGAASSSLRVMEGQADTIDSGAYTVSATLHPHGGAYAP